MKTLQPLPNDIFPEMTINTYMWYSAALHTLHDPEPPYTVELEVSLLHVPVTSHEGQIFLGWQQQSHSGEIHFSGEIHWLGTDRSSMVVVIKYQGTSNILNSFLCLRFVKTEPRLKESIVLHCALFCERFALLSGLGGGRHTDTLIQAKTLIC